MLHTTSAQLLDSIKRNDGGGFEVVRVGAGVDQTFASATTASAPAFNVPRGQVLLLTQFVTQPTSMIAGALHAFDPSPTGVIKQGFDIRDAANTTQSEASFWSFRRTPTQFVPGTPTAVDQRTAPPANIAVWTPKFPVAIPGGWDITPQNLGVGTPGQGGITDLGKSAAAYGILVDENSARTMGFQVNESATDADRRYGVSTFTSSGSIAARAGQSIRILDVNIRLQPETAGAAAIELLQAVGTRTLHKFSNQTPAEEIEHSFSPADSWYLGVNSALTVTFTGTNVGSIVISYEYVDSNDVPGGVFWGSVAATKPGSGASPVGLGSFQRRANTSITLFYPAAYNLNPAAATSAYTKTSPGTGDQHLLYGYALTAQKDTTAAIDQTLFTLTTGTTGGSVEASTLLNVQTEYQLAPVLQAAAHDQSISCVVDNLAIPCKPDDGSIWVTALGFGDGQAAQLLTVPNTTDHNLDEFQGSVWGRTVASRYTDAANQEV